MRERRQIVELWQRGNAAALVTLVRVEGSSYRRTGARLLIATNGEYVGAISGGCLDAEVIRKAQWLVHEGATVQRYSTLFDDTAEIPYGLGCGGTVDLLLEPAGTPEFAALMKAMSASLGGERQRVVTQLPGPGLNFGRFIFNEAAAPVFRSREQLLNLELPMFDERLEAPQRLFVFGAGDDAQPLVQMAALMGWRVFVIDGRAQLSTRQRFPKAECVAPSTFQDFDIGWRDAVVLMTHSFEQDRNWLAAIAPSAPRYLGLLGARHRSALLISEIAASLGWSLEQACDGIFAPVGLDIGGDGAEAIALAIVAEVQACCAGKPSLSRRFTPESVAEQIAQGDTSRYLHKECAL